MHKLLKRLRYREAMKKIADYHLNRGVIIKHGKVANPTKIFPIPKTPQPRGAN